MLRNFLEVLFSNNHEAIFSKENNADADLIDDQGESVQENYVNIINEMEKNVLKNPVFNIFDMVSKVTHRIVKINYDHPLKEIWDIMMDDKLKMAALESEANPENKIPNFIQGFVSHIDFINFFVENYEGDVSDFELSLKQLSVYFPQGKFESSSAHSTDAIKVIAQDEKLHVVLKKMLDYRIGMIPIVENLDKRRTIGLFFLKDIFWLLRAGKFEYIDKPVLTLLQTIYQDEDKLDSDGSEDEEDQYSEDGESDEEIDEDEENKAFLQNLDEDEFSRSYSFNEKLNSLHQTESDADLVQETRSNIKPTKSEDKLNSILIDTFKPPQKIVSEMMQENDLKKKDS